MSRQDGIASENSEDCAAGIGGKPVHRENGGTGRTRLQGLVCGLLLLPSVVWVCRDNRVWPWDPAWYGEVSVNLWCSLIQEPWRWPHAMLAAFEIKAPGLAWIGQFFAPVGQCLGSIETGLLLFVVLTQWATLVLSWKTLDRLFPGRVGLAALGILFIASAPLFVGMSHQYFVEPLQLFAVAYFFWLAVAAPSLERWQVVAHLLIATPLAMLAKITSPLYCLFPGLLALYIGLRRPPAPNSPAPGWRKAAPWFTLGSFLLVGALAWYGKHGRAILHFAREASSGELAAPYGHTDTFVHQLQFWLSASQRSFLAPAALVMVGLAVLAIVGVKLTAIVRGGFRCSVSHRGLVVAAAAAHVVTTLAVFASSINRETRYLLPLLPSLVVVWVFACSLVRQAWPVWGLCGLLLVQWTYVHALAAGWDVPAPLSGTPGGPWASMETRGLSFWLMPCRTNVKKKRELQALVRHTIHAQTHLRYHICGVELPWLNANSLGFHAAQYRLRTGFRGYYASLGYDETDTNRAWDRLFSLKAVYFISREESVQPGTAEFLNHASLPVLRRVEADPRFAREPFDSKLKVVVFRNREELGP